MKPIFIVLLGAFAVAGFPAGHAFAQKKKVPQVAAPISQRDSLNRLRGTVGVTDEPAPPPPNGIFTSVEQMPEPGFDVPKYLSDSLRYPPEARAQEIEGRVIVKFVVDEKGEIKHPVVERGVSPEMDAEALRLIKAMPRWKAPAMLSGKAVPIYYRVPVRFSLEG